MKVLVENKITVKRKGTPVFESRNSNLTGENVRENILGVLNINRGEIYIKMSLSDEEEVVDFFITKTSDGKNEVSITYHGQNFHFNGFFAEEKDCQFSSVSSEGMGYMGLFKTVKVKNNITKDGGRLVIKFKTIYSGVVTALCELTLDVLPFVYDLRS